MSSIMTTVILSCEKATELVIKKEENKISFIDNIRLWMHLQMCKFCKEFEGQNGFINLNMKNHFGEGCHTHHLSDEKKKEMKEAILQETK